MLSAQNLSHPLTRIAPVATVDEVLAARSRLTEVRVADSMRRYMVDLAAATRTASGVALGASPRASLALMKLSQALAAFDGEDFVSPEHVQEIAVETIAHRIVLERNRSFAGASPAALVEEIVRSLPVPA